LVTEKPVRSAAGVLVATGVATRGKEHRGDSPPSGKDALQGTCGSKSKAYDVHTGKNR